MSTIREKLFSCTFTSRTRTIQMTLSAWDERQAALIFREELNADGVTARGSILVLPVLGSPSRAFEHHADLG